MDDTSRGEDVTDGANEAGRATTTTAPPGNEGSRSTLLRSLRAHSSGLDEAALNGSFQMSGSPAASMIIINAEDEMATGTVKWFNQEKRFGFITPDVGGQDLFVHQTGLADGARSVTEGSNVEFDSEDGPKGPKATNVKVV
jgi:CspA family cold shock protein